MQRHGHDQVRDRKTTLQEGNLEEFDQRRDPFQSGPKFKLMYLVADNTLVDDSRSGKVEMKC